MQAEYVINTAGETIAYQITPSREPVLFSVQAEAGALVLRHGSEALSVPGLVFVIDVRAGESSVKIEIQGPSGAMIAAAHVTEENYEPVAVPWYGGSDRVWAELPVMPDSMFTIGALSLDANDPSPNKKKKFKIRVQPKDTQPPEVTEP